MRKLEQIRAEVSDSSAGRADLGHLPTLINAYVALEFNFVIITQPDDAVRSGWRRDIVNAFD